jgi:NAD+ synthase (glutamine-hydrolysing)
LTGYSIEDVLLQDTLLDVVEVALLGLVACSAELVPVLVVGAPLRYRHRIYNWLFAAEDVGGFVLHVEVCEDMWVPVPPSAEAALAGATVLANLSGSPITVGRAEQR